LQILSNPLSIRHENASRAEKFLFGFVNGRPITELQIDRRVSDGQFYIGSGLTTNEIELMKKDQRPRAARKK
jgi:hypothetical protein